MTNRTTYQPPVNKLLALGKQQCDYITELGLGSQHVPDLMKMAVDNELLGADSNSTEFWAAIHAWRVLGQLRVEDALAHLLPLFDLEDNDAVAEEMPKVYGRIGEKAIPLLQAYLGERSHGLLNRTTAINSLEEIANQYQNTRSVIVATLTHQLEQFNQNSAELNGFIVSSLVNLQARESASLIKHTFDASLVAEDIVGSWDDVRESLGISDDNQLEEFHLVASQKVFEVAVEEVEEVEEATTPSLELHQDNSTIEPVDEAEIVEQVTLPSLELHQDNVADEPVEVVTADETQVPVEVIKEATTPFVELHQDDNYTVESVEEVITADNTQAVESEIVEEVTTPFVELHQDNFTVEPAGEVACNDVVEVEVVEDAAIQMQQVLEAASENIQESTLSDIVAQTESILDDVTLMVDVTPIETRVKESIAVDDVTKATTDSLIENDNDIESLEKLSSDDVTSIATAKEQYKGFGGVSVKKEKSKGSKKKKPNFNDL
jgi:hypothetical protein